MMSRFQPKLAKSVFNPWCMNFSLALLFVLVALSNTPQANGDSPVVDNQDPSYTYSAVELAGETRKKKKKKKKSKDGKSNDLKDKDKVSKKKKSKKGNKQGAANVTIKMQDRTWSYNEKTKYLQYNATVKFCNEDVIIYEPWSTAIGISPETFYFDEVFPGCRSQKYVNQGDKVNMLAFFDSIHPDEYAAFCMYPKNQRCIKGTYTENELGALTSCEGTEACCGDNKDNDSDGAVDCDDSDCLGEKGCEDCTTVNVPARAVFRSANAPGDDTNCAAFYLIEWGRVKEELDEDFSLSFVLYSRFNNGSLDSRPVTPPFDDNHATLAQYGIKASEGVHWFYAGFSAKDDGQPTSCDDFSSVIDLFSDMSVDVTICKTANSKKSKK